MNRTLRLLLLLLLTTQAAHADMVSDGEKLFEDNCLHCHAEGGTATFMLGKRLGEDKSLLAERTDLDASYIEAVLRYGIGSMPWYRRTEITDLEAEALAAYLTRKRGDGQ